MNRVLGAARLQLINPLLSVGIGWAIVALAFVVNLAIWGVGDLDTSASDSNTGGLAALYITVLVTYIQAVTMVFPLAMGLSLSRRVFYLGTALVAVVQAVVFGIALAALTAVENATNGWGAGLEFWAPGAVDVGNPALQVVVFAVPMMAFAFMGIGLGVLYKRWGATGIYALTAALIVGTGALVVLLTWRRAWDDLGAWLTDRSVESFAIGLPAVAALALAALAYLGLRRAVP
ncbi:hypothetical protein O2W15_17330 [Modestobacter sp. VKM Ac-2979]|uniref:hypothetical protein n=1 Tax=unclassified Modestobacter TaxID=2643866 RepID=UPI0022AB6600|nr:MULTISPECIES: hypothetical protein [unclassified Modestobacter]MCZ2813196.1 hypothetical protein [Modestobacter sp. VKM Ac-2979]MCZ2844812.1 hypothetical protein [Modestobacter sp. VKM Ac-2980]